MEKISAAQAAKLLGISVNKLTILEKQGIIHFPYTSSEISQIVSRQGLTISDEASIVDSEIQRKVVSSVSFTEKILMLAGGTVSGYLLVVAVFTALFIVNPLQTAGWLGYISKTQNGFSLQPEGAGSMVLAAATNTVPGEQSSLIQAFFQPIAKASLGVVKAINPNAYSQVASATILDPNQVLSLDASGTIVPTQPIKILTSSSLNIATTDVIANLNSQYLQGKVPGTAVGDIAIVGQISGLTNSNLSENAGITLSKVSDMATSSFLGRNTASIGAPEVLSAATAKSILAITNTDISGLGTLSTQNSDAVSITGGTVSGLTGLTVASGIISLPNSSVANTALVNSSILVNTTTGTGISVSSSSIPLGGTLTLTGVDASTTTKGVASFNSTNFSVSSGVVNTIQEISTAAMPTFAGLSLGSGTLGAGSITGTSLTASGMSIAGFVKNSATGLLSGGNTIASTDISDWGSYIDQAVKTTSSPTFVKTTTGTFQLTTTPTNGYVLTSDALGNGTWQAASGGITSLTTSTPTNLTGFIKGNGSVLSADTNTYYKSGDSPSFANITDTGLTASRYMGTDVDKKLVSWSLATPIYLSSTSPAGVSGSSYKMMGLGSALSITPLKTGVVELIFDFDGYYTGGSGLQGTLKIKYGTGSAPANQNADTGTQIGKSRVWGTLAVGQSPDYSQSVIVTGLSVGTAYWFDASVAQTIGSSGTVQITNVTATLKELP